MLGVLADRRGVSKIGAIYHITYPVLVRAPFGMIGAYPAIVVRGESHQPGCFFVFSPAVCTYGLLIVLRLHAALVAIMWTSLLCVQGSGFLHSCITALWPSFEQFPNHLPASAGIDCKFPAHRSVFSSRNRYDGYNYWFSRDVSGL